MSERDDRNPRESGPDPVYRRIFGWDVAIQKIGSEYIVRLREPVDTPTPIVQPIAPEPIVSHPVVPEPIVRPPVPPPPDPRIALEAAAEAEAAAWIAAQEQAHPHPGDRPKLTEHMAALALVDVKQATHRAIQGGDWCDPRTWAGRRVPDDGARVWIMPDRNVFLEGATARIRTLRISGTLEFDTEFSTTLNVETAVVDPEGELLIGDQIRPIHPDVTARVIFSRIAPRDPLIDPFDLGLGLISHGRVDIYGATVTPHLPLARHPRTGDTSIELSEPPTGWKAGDELVLSVYHPADTPQRRSILAINGTTVTLNRPLLYSYQDVPDDPTKRSRVGHLTRNVRFESEDPGRIENRGHFMQMHSNAASVKWASFIGGGRTDKSRPVTDPVLDEYGVLVPGTDANARGRYDGPHLHLCGPDITKPPIEIQGVVVDSVTGWGIDNHASHVWIWDSVGVGGVARFVCESGIETGRVFNNFGLGCRPMGIDDESNSDYGHGGSPFYSASSAVPHEDNVSNGSHAGYRVSQYPFKIGGVPVQFLRSNVADPSLLPPDARDLAAFDPNLVPLMFRNNETFGVGTAFWQSNHKGGSASVLDGLIGWNIFSGIYTQYSDTVVLRRSTLLHYPAGDIWGVGIEWDWNVLLQVEDSTISGFWLGLKSCMTGETIVRRTTLACLVNVAVPRTDEGFDGQVPRRQVLLEDVTWGWTEDPLRPRDHADIYIYSDQPERPSDVDAGTRFSLVRHLTPDVRDRRLPAMFHPDPVLLQHGEATYQVYSDDQKSGFVYRDTGLAELDGKTAQEVWDQHHMAIGGALMPDIAKFWPDFLNPSIDGGRLGPPVPLLSTLNVELGGEPGNRTVKVTDMGPVARSRPPQVVAQYDDLALPTGWSIVHVIDADGRQRGVLVNERDNN